MAFHSLRHRNSQFTRFIASSLLLVEATVATSVMGAIAATQPGWITAQPSFAQTRPTTVSTSARDLGKPLQVNCQPSNPDGAPEDRPEFCGGSGSDFGMFTDPIPENPIFSIQPPNDENLFDFIRPVLGNRCQPARDRIGVCIPLP